MEPLANEDILILQKGKTERFWRIVTEELERRVEELTERTMDEKMTDAEDMKRLKFKASVYKSLIGLPDRLIKENEPIPVEKKADPSDPY